MRLALVLLSLLVAGCATPAAQVAPAAVDARASSWTDLPVASGEFLVATHAPLPAPPCPGVGSVLAPEPGPGAWVEWSLPSRARAVQGELTEEAMAGMEIGYRLCVFQGEQVVLETDGSAPLSFEVALDADSPLRVLVAPHSGPTTLNAGARLAWTLSGSAAVIAPEAAAGCPQGCGSR